MGLPGTQESNAELNMENWQHCSKTIVIMTAL